MTIIINILKLLLFIYLIIGAILYIKQRDILYHPKPAPQKSFDELNIKNDAGIIKTFVLNRGHKNAILYFGGNAESVGYSADAFAKNFPNHTVYLINYRGYGGSSGNPTEENLYADALLVYDKVREKHADIHVIGRSLGSGVATYLASKRPVNRLVLVTPFDSIESVAQERFPIYPMQIILKDKYKSIDRVSDIKAHKTLIVIGGEDKVVTNEHSQRLYDAFVVSKVKELYLPRGHNDIQLDKSYFEEIRSFINSYTHALECTYYNKPSKKYPYGDMLHFKDCGEVIGDELHLKKKHLSNMSFKKGEESDYGLSTVYSTQGTFYISKIGKSIKMYFYDMGADYFVEGLARYISNEKIGFVNPKLDIVIPAKYDYATSFKNGLALVSNGCHQERDKYDSEHSHIVGGLWGAIDKNGKVIIAIEHSRSEVERLIRGNSK